MYINNEEFGYLKELAESLTLNGFDKDGTRLKEIIDRLTERQAEHRRTSRKTMREHRKVNKNYGKSVTYAEGKEALRQEAIEWQADFANHNYSYGELAEFAAYFTKMAKQYGLIEEFKENGII